MRLFMLLWLLSIRTCLYVIIQDIQYNCERYMALALVVQKTFSILLAVTRKGAKGMFLGLGVGRLLSS
jgi:hypothetical protein